MNIFYAQNANNCFLFCGHLLLMYLFRDVNCVIKEFCFMSYLKCCIKILIKTAH